MQLIWHNIWPAVGLLALFAIAKHLGPLIPYGLDAGFLLTFLYQLYVPLWLIEKEGKTLASYGVHANHAGRDFFLAILLALITLPIYGVLFIALHGPEAHFVPRLPPDFFRLVWTSLLLVALPEELFYRGFLQTRLSRLWPTATAIFVTSLFFALAHFIGEYHPARLLPFFPAILFSIFRLKSGSIAGPVIYHAICNVFSNVLTISLIGE